MLSLAAIRYRSVLESEGGPISFIEEGELSIQGVRYFQANAHLRASLVPRRERQLYSPADGSGMHASPMVARHKAISEALERWAYFATVSSPKNAVFGFHVDRSSNGMASFPGLSKRSARKVARYEAIERFCVLNWWEGYLEGTPRPTKWPGVTAVSFVLSETDVAVILFMRSDSGRYAYGHAAGWSFDAACERAHLEMFRHEWAISSWINNGRQSSPDDLFEKRALFFSTDKGHGVFENRLVQSAIRKPLPVRLVVCDSEIIGPWSKYSTVWRYLLRPPSERFLSSDGQYFFW